MNKAEALDLPVPADKRTFWLAALCVRHDQLTKRMQWAEKLKRTGMYIERDQVYDAIDKLSTQGSAEALAFFQALKKGELPCERDPQAISPDGATSEGAGL